MPDLPTPRDTQSEENHFARQLLRLQQTRKRQFAPVEITGPGWNLMLALFAVPADSAGLGVGQVAQKADIPRTTAIRWLRRLEHHHLVRLAADPADKRVIRVNLTRSARGGMHASFAAALST